MPRRRLHMPSRHARFSPSSADRYIHCTPSLRLGEEHGPPDTGSVYTAEGTEAHELGEYLLRQSLGEEMADPRPSMKYYNDEMQECAEGYRDAVLDLYNQLRLRSKDVALFIEQEVSFEAYVPGGFGTSDCVIIGGGEMFVVDYKHGKGVPVSAEGDGTGNSQLKCYALGAWLAFESLYDIQKITLVIYQPRIGNFSQFSLSAEELLSWADKVLRPAAALALAGEGELACGSWCRFCRAKAVCRKRAEENLALARYDFARPPTLEDDEVNLILARLPDLEAWASDIRDYALQRALSGYAWDDFKLVEGRSTRHFTDEEAVAKIVADAGYDPYERKVKGITSLTSTLGKSRFNELLGNFIEKTPGKPTLVPRADKRPELFVTQTPQQDFSTI